jgi:hypothetical protein
MIVARQFIAWYSRENRNRPVGHGTIGSVGVLRSGRLINPESGSDRALRDGFSIERVSGNELPGYDHLVPPDGSQMSGSSCIWKK